MIKSVVLANHSKNKEVKQIICEYMMKLTKKDIAINGVLAAAYFVLTLITYPLSYGLIQVRLSEILIILCFFNPKYLLGLTVGCLLANTFSTLNILDTLIGTVATLLSCVLISLMKNLLLSCLIPIIINAFLIGLEIYLFIGSPYWVAVGYVALGEFVVMVVSYILFANLRKSEKFLKLIDAKRNVDFKF